MRRFGWAITRFFNVELRVTPARSVGSPREGSLCSSGIRGVTRGCPGVLLIKLFDN